MTQFYTGLSGFDKAAPSFYKGPAGALPGAQLFTAAALILPNQDTAGAGNEPIFGNLAAGAGWVLRRNFRTFFAEVYDTGGLKSASATADDTLFGHLSLLHIRVTPTDVELYVNGSISASTPLTGPIVPAAGSAPFVGFDGVDHADDMQLFGLAYDENDGVVLSDHFQACRAAADMAGSEDLSPTVGFRNLWSTKRGNNGTGQPNFFATPTLQLRLAQDTWLPELGSIPLTRTGVPQLFVRGFKDCDWGPGAP